MQFSRETCDMNSGCSGRIEHLSSGRRAHFDSPRQLLAVLERLLLDLGEKDA
ncbi:MAG: hypothetical protein ABI624_05365 [Casimicrobiaceae bacterium]